ncbi:Uncharacterised protein [Haemophilus influenzae]|uniref:hypothetical protein n=1 Tax=Haemophilus influenzae TaxID=727 RepID=UPI000DA3514E|nr:hypothetical protein [Haemophilus influenzae]SQK93963.1 Uncharacterised protein [Haemophilus influenzae]
METLSKQDALQSENKWKNKYFALYEKFTRLKMQGNEQEASRIFVSMMNVGKFVILFKRQASAVK